MIVLLHCFEHSCFFDQVVLELEEVHLVKEGLWGLELGSHLDLEVELAQVKDLVGSFWFHWFQYFLKIPSPTY